MDVLLSPRKVLLLLLSVIGFLFLANGISIVSIYGFGHNSVYGLVNLFNFDQERNVPTLYSSIQLFVVSLLLLTIGTKHRNDGSVPWIVLSVIFLFLVVDETAEIHEQFAERAGRIMGVVDVSYFVWVIPYGIAALLFVIMFSRFLLSLPKETTLRFIAAGAIYVTGAFVFDILGARYKQAYGEGNVMYSFFYTCEELLEMIGIAFFIYALLMYVSNRFQYLRATIKN